MTCPICKKPTVSGYRPFCSKRCADVDLGKWFIEAYAMPSSAQEDADAAEDDPGHATREHE